MVRARPRSPVSLIAALVLLLAAWPAAATQVVHFDTRALVRGSSDIVIGEIAGTRSYWNDRHTKILTEVSVRISETLKGTPAQTIALVELGGEVDGMRYNVPGCPVFRSGEQALLFVWRDRAGRPQVNALAQGKFEIRRDPATGRSVVQRSLPGLAMTDARSLRAVPSGEPAPRIPLDDMKREIQSVLAEDGR